MDLSCRHEQRPPQHHDVAVWVNSLVQCGQRVALIGIVIAQAGHSFETGPPAGDGLFNLFIALTTRKMQKATMMKLITRVTKFP
jgi:hypothetical protein